MARPTKQGVDYFPLDVQFDDKLELLIAEVGHRAVSVVVTIWQLIYQNEGYFIHNNHKLPLLIKRRILMDPEDSIPVIEAAIRHEVFDPGMYADHQILTSRGIQKRYFLAAKNKKSVSVNENYVMCGVNVGGNSISSGVNGDGNTTKVKVKENVKENVKEEEQHEKVCDGENATPERLVELFNAVPGLKPTRTLTRETRKTITARIRDHPNMAWWVQFVDEQIRPSRFLCGQVNDFAASLVWVCGPKNMGKILAGEYADREHHRGTREGRTIANAMQALQEINQERENGAQRTCHVVNPAGH